MTGKKVVLGVPPALQEQLTVLKKELYFDKPWNDLYKHVLEVGCKAMVKEMKK